MIALGMVLIENSIILTLGLCWDLPRSDESEKMAG